MEIPGLTRLKSPTQEENLSIVEAAMSASTPQALPPSTSIQALPQIEASLEAKIEAMRARMKAQSVNTTLVTESTTAHIPNTEMHSVNYNILEQTLANHGFEAIADSDDEMKEAETMQESVQSSGDSSDSDDDSDDDSTSDSDDDDDSVVDAPLTAQERERILIEADNDGATKNEVPRTKNELAEEEEPVRVPDFEIGPTEPIELLGTVTSVVGGACVVTGMPTPETKVLDIGTLLVFQNRKNLGYIADTFGPVILPMFAVRFESAQDLATAGVALGQQIYVVPKHAVYVFSDTLKVKGTDASNIHDEEQSETEFSDDEQEAHYKAQKKYARKMEKQGSKPRTDDRPLNDLESIAQAQGLVYDRTNRSVQPQDRAPQHSSGGQSYRGRGAQRGSRGSRGRPETNNYGRGPDRQVSRDEQVSVAEPYQRSFYQPEPQTSTTMNAPPVQVATTHAASTAPVLYHPLKRPT